MGIIPDIIILVIFALSVFIAYKRGLASVLYNLASWIITIILVIILLRPITNLIVEKTNFDESISEKLEVTLEENFKENFESGDLIKEDDSNMSNAIISVINGYISEAKETGKENIAKFIAEEISYTVVSAVVAIGIFFFARFVSLLLKFTLEFIINLPLLHAFNKVGGIIFGVIRGFILIYLVLAIFSLLSPIMQNSNIISLIKSSYICSIFYNNNLLLKILIH